MKKLVNFKKHININKLVNSKSPINVNKPINRKMLMLILCFIISLCLCSCSEKISDTTCELTSRVWSATPSKTAKITLFFDENKQIANLSLENNDLKKSISGKFIVDDTSFVIFEPKISKNYYFEYNPMGDYLNLTYNKMTIKLKANN